MNSYRLNIHRTEDAGDFITVEGTRTALEWLARFIAPQVHSVALIDATGHLVKEWVAAR